MNIIGVKPGHDGSICQILDSELQFSYEAEKGNNLRHSPINLDLIFKSLKQLNSTPDILAVGGWDGLFSGYCGTDNTTIHNWNEHFLGNKVHMFSSSHERSHLMCSYGMSPYPQGQPCYALIWESWIGRFYYIDKDLNIHTFPTVLDGPGYRYAYLLHLASPNLPNIYQGELDLAGKLMAISAFGKKNNRSNQIQETIKLLFGINIVDNKTIDMNRPINKEEHKGNYFYNIGLDSTEFHDLARQYSDAIFEKFYTFAKKNFKQKLPLLISGGCGLNCQWNSYWEETNLFSDVFVPPCCDDSGSAIGTAIDAQYYFTNKAKVKWTVYSGEVFEWDSKLSEEFIEIEYNSEVVANYLYANAIFAWVEGRYEIGPRALGHRSIIAAPFSEKTTKELNKIKLRESYRPIAPICKKDHMSKWFEGKPDSPYMLFFHKVNSENLKAVSHVDNSARTQSIEKSNSPWLYQVLEAFERKTGYAVLCNTSLNFNGKGCINRLSQIEKFVLERGLTGMCIDGRLFIKKEFLLNF